MSRSIEHHTPLFIFWWAWKKAVIVLIWHMISQLIYNENPKNGETGVQSETSFYFQQTNKPLMTYREEAAHRSETLWHCYHTFLPTSTNNVHETSQTGLPTVVINPSGFTRTRLTLQTTQPRIRTVLVAWPWASAWELGCQTGTWAQATQATRSM